MPAISVDLEERELVIGETTVTLSNYNIKHIRQCTDGKLDEETVETVIEQLIEQQIKPFLNATDRPIEDRTVEQELSEAFDTHLYSYADPD